MTYMEKKVCENCGKEFETQKNTKYCCPQCYWEAIRKSHWDYQKKKATGVI